MIVIPSTVILKFCLVNMIFLLLMIKRTYDTYNFRMEILDAIHGLAEKDIDNRRHWKWRYDTFELVSFYKMTWMFWRQLVVEEWWEDTSFVEETKHG